VSIFRSSHPQSCAPAEVLRETLVRKACALAKRSFRAAFGKNLITVNPFSDMKNVTIEVNGSRNYFINVVEAAAVLEACPRAEWRLLFALCQVRAITIVDGIGAV
jgi:hypothetical protein